MFHDHHLAAAAAELDGIIAGIGHNGGPDLEAVMNLSQIPVTISDVDHTGILPRDCSSTRICPVKASGVGPFAGLPKQAYIST